MRAVLDEGVPRQLIIALRELGCDVEPFPREWKGLKNGILLQLLEQSGFDCLITCDKNMEWQQSLRKKNVGLLVLPFQKLALLEPIARDIITSLALVRPGEITRADNAR